MSLRERSSCADPDPPANSSSSCSTSVLQMLEQAVKAGRVADESLARAERSEAQLRATRGELEGARAEVARTRLELARLETSSAEIVTLKASEIERLKREVAERDARLEALRETIQRVEDAEAAPPRASSSPPRERLVEEPTTRDVWTTRLEESEAKIKALASQAHEANEAATRWMSALTHSDRLMRAASEQLEQSEARRAETERRLAEARFELTRANVDASSLNARLNRLTEDFVATRVAKNALEAQLAECHVEACRAIERGLRSWGAEQAPDETCSAMVVYRAPPSQEGAPAGAQREKDVLVHQQEGST